MIISRLPVLCHTNALGEKAAPWKSLTMMCVFFGRDFGGGIQHVDGKTEHNLISLHIHPTQHSTISSTSIRCHDPFEFGGKIVVFSRVHFHIHLFSNHYRCCKIFLKLTYRTLTDPWYVGQLATMCKCGGEAFPVGCIAPHGQTCRLLLLKAWSSDQQHCHHLGAYYKCRQTPPQTHWVSICH